MIPFQGNDGIGRGRPTTMGVVLAAGAGRRYGGPKIVAEQGNWLDLALGALRDGGCDFVGLCMGARFVDPPPGVLGITVDDWDEGLGASVRAALREAIAADAQRLVLHLVDLPDVTACSGPGLDLTISPGRRMPPAPGIRSSSGARTSRRWRQPCMATRAGAATSWSTRSRPSNAATLPQAPTSTFGSNRRAQRPNSLVASAHRPTRRG